ncbi:MAG: UDP-glucose 4-epimerase [Verrucomicrobia bacterium Tous-C9LFEB]|nr:MAG: UDP-glucose 4-epimerase [Verrucomicrobia bacterium Tous-C9LFEB]
MKTLVTGGAGFIGSHVVDALITAGHNVVVLDDLSGGFTENVNPKARFVQGSILDHDLINRLFDEHHFEYVFHLAAYAAEGLSHFIRRFNYQNNLVGSVNLINASVLHNVRCFVFTSSIAVYGKNQLPMVESLQPNPEDPYGIAKFAVELDLRAAHEMYGLNYVIFRPHNVYGERQNIGDKYRNVLGIFMNNVMQGKPMTVFGDGGQTRAFSYIADVAPLIASSITNPACQNQVFNVGSDDWHSVNEISALVAEAFGVKPDIAHLPERKEVVHAYASHEKLKGVFPDQTHTTLRDGVFRMAHWAKKHGPKQSSEFGHIEVPLHLPAGWSVKKEASHS